MRRWNLLAAFAAACLALASPLAIAQAPEKPKLSIGVGGKSLSRVQVVQRVSKAMKHRAGPGTRQECGRFAARIAHQQMGEFQRSLVVRNAAEDRAAKGKKVDEPHPLFNARETPGRVRLEALDLCPKVAQCNRPMRHHGRICVRSASRPLSVKGGDHGACTFGGLGGAKYGKTLDDQAIGPSMPSLMRAPFPPLM